MIRDVARKQLLGIMGTSFVFAGVSGMPLAGAGTMLANLLMNDKDKPFDAETELENSLGSLAYKGPINQLLNLEISSRTGWNDMFWKDDPKRMAEVGAFDYIAERAMGPAYSALIQTGEAFSNFQQGHFIFCSSTVFAIFKEA